jgi:signal transduction histidine kinase
MDLLQSDIRRIADFARAATKAPNMESVISESFKTLNRIAETERIRIVYSPAPARWTEWKSARNGLEVRPHDEWPRPKNGMTTVFFDEENEQTGFVSAANTTKKIRLALDYFVPSLWSALTLHVALARAQSVAVSEGELVRAAFRARDEERRHIARELHDDLGQSLASLKLGLKWTDDLIYKKRDLDAAAVELQKLRGDVVAMVEKVRDLSHSLYPRILDSLGFVAAVKDLAHQVSSHSDLTVECVARGAEKPLPKDVGVAVYRCCQEAINNAVRHSGASQLTVLIQFARKEVRVSVEDDGKGFDPRTLYDSNSRMMSSGFWTIRQRMADLHGAFRVSTAQDRGTLVEMIVPYSSKRAHERPKNKTAHSR